ncbi:MAG: DUF5694 domain-containing protein [Brevundimonas sp.]|uniref:DUF5694 domain-containing protein n=1 Tax=Brevundimonas sp. TaxID=1871086 RepID=UPI0026314D8D|nr:DUF5694 domain-containing protein [Brevundimonas sp.]MDI6624435.1 DUF5694 domain-containing protein [Brevundimonas sp.]MDQ7811511.1 DUF5694 domain-containing protein [Brevundimonas sp.]
MLKIFAAVAALILPTAALAQTPEPEPVEVMILGAYHMGNPGQDLHNARVDPVTTPEKQAQLEAVAEGLARFRPTAVAVERIARDQATMLDHRYPAFTPADLLTNPDERVQLGYRLAHRLGLDRVYAIDEQDREGQPSYFPFGDVQSWAEANGGGERLGAMHGEVTAMLADLERRQGTETVGQLLSRINAPERVRSDQGFYARLMTFGAADDQLGAVLNARWYARNAQIFARLLQVARPGDRIVVIYGSGHNYWLRQMVETMPGYVLVEPGDYLPKN